MDKTTKIRRFGELIADSKEVSERLEEDDEMKKFLAEVARTLGKELEKELI